ncbi:MAG: MFS transporter [Minisyncoccales bacterium]
MKIFINRLILFLIFFDFIFQSAWGLISPFFAIFIVQKIEGGNLVTLGLALAIFWIFKSLFQPLISYWTDRTKSEKDDFLVLFLGSFLISFVPLGYLWAKNIFHIFALELVRALAMASIVPLWSGFFTRHIDKGWESFSWSLDSTVIGLTFGFSALFGGAMANLFGFSLVFLIVSFLSFLATFSLLLVKKELRKNFQYDQ